jgi:uncharacterized Zn-finger protein
LPGRVISGLLMTPFEIIEIDEMIAACNGGGGPLGHPRVYLNLAPAGRVECPYCSRTFVNRAVARQGGVAPEVGVVMPSAQRAGDERPSESPAPRQVGEAAGGGNE